jgi:translation initiation factor eIF-2B subunit epsilon
MRTYAAISRDVVQRWTFPLVPDANFSGGTRYAHQRGNIYLEAPVKMSHTALVQAGSVVGAGTSIGAGSTIRASVLGRRCQIGADVFIENSFLWDDVVVEDCAVVRNSIVCSNAVLRQGARVEHDCVVSFGVVVGVGARLEPGVRLTRLQPSAAELEFDAEPTAPIALGEGGVGRRWVHVLEELENSLAVPGLQPRVSSGTLSSASDADLGIESESDEESEAAELDPQERLFHEVQDTILSNAEISAAMLPSLATELHTRIFAHNKELNLGMQDVAKPVLRTLLELIVSRAPKKASQKDLLALMTSTLKKWSTLLRYFVGNSLESQISILCTTRDYCEKDRRGVFDKLIPFLFRLLYEEDVVAEEAFLAWEERESRVEGAAAFLKKAELFLKWIREADEESEEEEDEN